jgi:predicted O-linked N-acetylglucosamine transferase (SPINDLY family)
LAEALSSLGNVLQDQGRLQEAVSHYREAIAIAPDTALHHNNLGCALVRLGQVAEAAASLRKAIALQPDFVAAHLNLGNAASLLGERAEALGCYEIALRIDPGNASARDAVLFEMQRMCDWSRFDELCEAQRRAVRERSPHSISPFSLLTIPATRAEHLLCARAYSARLVQSVNRDRARLNFRFGLPVQKPRLKIGYLSADYHEHVTAYVMAEMFELHDRKAFEVTAYSYGPDDRSAMRSRLVRGFDRFIDISRHPHADAASLIHEDGIDILVDLKGYTQDARPEIAALRPAPIQAAYMGYPGILGADFIDYYIADRFVIPPEHASDYTEKLVLLPGCYYVNDRRKPAPPTPPRAELGLPEHAFVFCSFNQSCKILPQIFAAWMRLLQAVPGSVLWLLEENRWAVDNLRREARARGVEPARLHFAKKLPLERHLARVGAADLFLDTLPYNAHTTATDALWAGVPVITCPGETHASRVAGSLLKAAGLPELITSTMAEYEALAVSLAQDLDRLRALRERLMRSRASAPLFDTPAFVRGLETAYTRMWQFHVAGRQPQEIDLSGAIAESHSRIAGAATFPLAERTAQKRHD